MQPLQIKVTLDGSHSLLQPDINETYHSTNGAIQESEHIFIQYGLNECKKDTITILEIGFGTGLNAFLTLLRSEQYNKKINYIALEKHPLTATLAEQLNYAQLTDSSRKADFLELHRSYWNKPNKITNDFSLLKLSTDFTTWQPTTYFDVIYFDAFSPEKQPEMWTEDMFRKIYTHSNLGAVLTTYCAKGAVRRAMQSAGFGVERLPGPIGKREILRATKKKTGS